MSKRVQHVRHSNAAANLFLGLDGEVTVNQGNKSVHVHDGITIGGIEQARADLNNVAVASSLVNGKMSIQQAVDLAAVLVDMTAAQVTIIINTATGVANAANIATNLAAQANKTVPAATNNIATLSATGDLQDSGDLLSDYFKLAGGGGNVMLFYQTAAPVGWTKIVTQNNKVLRVVSGAGGVAGGTDSFSAVFSKTATDTYTLLEADVPAHAHGSAGSHSHSITGGSLTASLTYNTAQNGYGASGGPTVSTNSGGTHTHTSFGGSGAHSHGLANFDIQYIDLILCSKD